MKLESILIFTLLGLVTFGECGRSRVEDVTSHETGTRNNRRVMDEGRRPQGHHSGPPQGHGGPQGGPGGPQGHHGPPQGHGGPPQGHGGPGGQGPPGQGPPGQGATGGILQSLSALSSFGFGSLSGRPNGGPNGGFNGGPNGGFNGGPNGGPNGPPHRGSKSGEESGEEPPHGWKLSGSSSTNGKPPKDRSDLLINAPHSLWDTVNLLSNFVWRFFLDGYHFITHAFRSDFDHWRGFRFSNLVH